VSFNDGVTRATRIYRYGAPGTRVTVIVIDERPQMTLEGLPRVQDR
jgi:hypothetical protein